MSSTLIHRPSRAHAGDVKSQILSGWSIGLVLAAVVALVALSLAARATPYFSFDLPITQALQSIDAGWFTGLMMAVGFPGYPPQVYIWVALVTLLLWFVGARWEAVSFVFATAGVSALGMAFKMFVARPRPSPDIVTVWNPGLQGGGLSFPAGHVQVYVTVLGFLMYLILRQARRTWWQTALLIVFGVMIALIGVARITSGEHWFSDVVGGYLIGSIGLWLTITFYEWGKPRFFVEKNSETVEEHYGR